MLLHNIIIANN